MEIKFIIPGKPQPQERRVVRNRFWAYDPPKSAKAKKLVAQYALLSLQENGNTVFGPEFTGRLGVSLKCHGARLNADLDNLYKLVTDALQGLLYRNDSQIDKAEISRHPAHKGDERTEVEIISL